MECNRHEKGLGDHEGQGRGWGAKQQGGKGEGRGWLGVDGLRNKVVSGIWNAVERLRNKKRAWVTE